jgi:hypothetical protein
MCLRYGGGAIKTGALEEGNNGRTIHTHPADSWLTAGSWYFPLNGHPQITLYQASARAIVRMSTVCCDVRREDRGDQQPLVTAPHTREEMGRWGGGGWWGWWWWWGCVGGG